MTVNLEPLRFKFKYKQMDIVGGGGVKRERESLYPYPTIRRENTEVNRDGRNLFAAACLPISLIRNLLPYSSCTHLVKT